MSYFSDFKKDELYYMVVEFLREYPVYELLHVVTEAIENYEHQNGKL